MPTIFVDDVAQPSFASSGGRCSVIVHQQPFRCKSLKLMGFLHFNHNRNTGVFVREGAVLPIFFFKLDPESRPTDKKM